MSTHEFESTLVNELAVLRREDQELAKKEAELRSRRSEVASKVGELQTALRVYREVMRIPSVEPSPAGSPLVGEIPLGTIADMCAAYMEMRGGAADVSELVAFLEQRGKFRSNGHPRGHYGTVFGTLQRDLKFDKEEGRGRFILHSEQESTA